MRKRRLKLLLIMVMSIIMLSGISVTSYAGYTPFDVTVTKGTDGPDPLSPRYTKEDEEQRFYVTPTYFSGYGSICAYSIALDDSVFGMPREIKSTELNVTKSNSYNTYASSGKPYYMRTYWWSGSNTLNVRGRFTP